MSRDYFPAASSFSYTLIPDTGHVRIKKVLSDFFALLMSIQPLSSRTGDGTSQDCSTDLCLGCQLPAGERILILCAAVGNEVYPLQNLLPCLP